MLHKGGKARQITLGGVDKNKKSDKQKSLEKRTRKVNRRVKRGKGLKTGGFRFGSKEVVGENTSGIRKNVQESINATNPSPAERKRLESAADKNFNKSTRRISVKKTPATLGNINVVGSTKSKKQ